MENQTFLHVTAPYKFASDTVAQSATTPLMDPQTGDHVMQILIDFFTGQEFDDLQLHTFLSPDGFTFLVATQTEADSDTVLAPGFLQNTSAPPIAKQILPFDFPCDRASCNNAKMDFADIVNEMKQGLSGSADFVRTSLSGRTERIHMGYAPVEVKSFRALDSSDFGRGVEVKSYLIYSLALAEPETAILEPFQTIEETTTSQVRVSIIVISVLIALSSLGVVYVSRHVAASVTAPMLYVLDLLRLINQ